MLVCSSKLEIRQQHAHLYAYRKTSDLPLQLIPVMSSDYALHLRHLPR